MSRKAPRELRATWQVRVRSEFPHVIEDTRGFTAPYISEPREGLPIVMKEARIMIGRASYMVEGPNREVMWSVELWDKKAYRWHSVVQGKSTVKAGARPL